MNERSAMDNPHNMQQPQSSAAKDEILARIKDAQSLAFSGRDIATNTGIVTGTPGSHYPIPREYERSRDISQADVLSLADERISDYKARVHRCGPSATDINAAIRQVLADVDAKIIGIPTGLNRAWVADVAEVAEVRVDEGMSARELDQLDAIVTSSAVTCAETGTIFLDGSPTSGRRALSLVPDVHICVVEAETVVYGIPEAIARLREADPTVPITMISGPSATSDIELSRVEGVHGPRTLEVIIAG